MDPRVREHVEIVVEHSVDLRAGDDVVISTPPVAEDLGVALHEAAGDVGANPVSLFESDRAERAYLRAGGEDFGTPDHELALVEAADASIRVLGARNATQAGDVPPDTTTAYEAARNPVKEAMLETPWCLIQWPAPVTPAGRDEHRGLRELRPGRRRQGLGRPAGVPGPARRETRRG